MRVRVGIITALPIEGRSLCRKHKRLDETLRIGDHVLLRAGGIGENCATTTAEHLINEGANALISWGSAGGIAPKLNSGTLLLPEKVIDDHDNTFFVSVPWQKHILALLKDKLALETGSLFHSRQLLSDRESKHRIYQAHDVVAVDMESYPVAKIAHEAQIPFMIIRALADPAHVNLPSVIQSSIFEGKLQYAHLLKGVIRKPSSVIELYSLFKYFNHAMSTLTKAINILGFSQLTPRELFNSHPN